MKVCLGPATAAHQSEITTLVYGERPNPAGLHRSDFTVDVGGGRLGGGFKTASLPAVQTRLLTPADFAAAAALQRQVERGLPYGFIRGKSERDLQAYLDDSLGIACGVDGGAGLSSMALLRLPTPAHPPGGECFPHVPPSDWPLRAAILEHAMVLPAARGFGHHQALISARMAHVRRCAVPRWICTGVQLANTGSWRNLLRHGLMIVGSRTRDGVTLLALLMSLDDTVLHTAPSKQRRVVAQDAEAHAGALRAGYFGVRPAVGGTVIYQQQQARAKADAGIAILPEVDAPCRGASLAVDPQRLT